MLVLTRQANEQIVIDGNIIVTVVAVEGNKIRLGIQAPKSVRVDRAEVHSRRVSEANELATTSPREARRASFASSEAAVSAQ